MNNFGRKITVGELIAAVLGGSVMAFFMYVGLHGINNEPMSILILSVCAAATSVALGPKVINTVFGLVNRIKRWRG